ncbi:MAG: FAD-dependent oxidoreductase [Anaerolineales bacterium]|nr:FAD-dependent oxidoreductase [Anaerolineales bacterium]
MATTIEVAKQKCTGCSYCVVGCPAEAIHLEIQETVWPSIDPQACIECGDCIYLCPNNVFSAPALEAPPVALLHRYDAIVVGAGIGGLMTAAGLARAGKKVLVLEQLLFLGGKYTHLTYKDYAISTAAWTCPGPKSRIGRLCTKLGAPIEWVTIHDTKARGDHWVLTRDGKRYPSTDAAQLDLVGGARGMAKVYQWMGEMYDPSVHYPDDMTAREYIEKYFPGNEAYIKYVETIITYCFASQTVDHFSAMETKRAIVDALEQMAVWGTATGGTAAIVAGLEKVLRQHGGEIATRTRVKRFQVEQAKGEGARPKVTGVVLEDGREISADIVVHNAGLSRLVGLVGEENIPADYLQRLRSAVPAVVAALILGTKEALLGTEHSLLHTMGWERTLNCYAPTFFDPGLAPKGKHALDVFWAMQPPYNLRQELDLVLGQLRQVFPGFDEAVELQVPMFFQGGWTAEMAHRLGQSGVQRLDPISPLDHLYLVGYDCIGYGMAGDIIPHGVEKALYTILGDPLYAPEDEKTSTKLAKWAKSRLLKGMAVLQRFKGK